MFKRFNTLTLLIAVAVLLAAVVLITYRNTVSKQRSFLKNLVETDTARVSKILISPKSEMEREISLIRKSGNWFVVIQNNEYQADSRILNQMLAQLTRMQPLQLLGRGQEAVESSETGDDRGIRVKVYEGSREKANFIVGKLFFQQQDDFYSNRPKISTHIRLKGSNDIYLVEGYLGATFSERPEQYRDKTVLAFPVARLIQIESQGPGTYSFRLQKNGDSWTMNGLAADSTNTSLYIQTLSRVNSSDFVNDASSLNIPIHTLKLLFDDEKLVEVKAFEADSIHKFYVTSTMNEGSVFSGNRGGLFNTLFHTADYFFPKKE